MNDDPKGTQGNQAYTQEADQAARLRQLREDQRARNGSAGDDDGGRPTTTQAQALSALPLAAPAWSRALASLPPERPLGYDINAQVDMETCWWDPDAIGPRGATNEG